MIRATAILPLLLLTALAFSPPPASAQASSKKDFLAAVTCEGDYRHHLQGICLDDGEGAIFWSFTTELVKTDRAGKVLKKIPVANHHGDLCFHDGNVYVAVNLGRFNDPKGNADSWVYVYDADSLELLARHATPEVFHGAGGIGVRDGRFTVVGGLPDGVEENIVYEYDAEFRFLKKHLIASGWTRLGIQTAAWQDGAWWFGCYGSPKILLKTDADFKMRGRFEFDCSLGIAGLGPGRLLVAKGPRTPEGRCLGEAHPTVAHEKGGLRIVEEKAATAESEFIRAEETGTLKSVSMWDFESGETGLGANYYYKIKPAPDEAPKWEIHDGTAPQGRYAAKFTLGKIPNLRRTRSNGEFFNRHLREKHGDRWQDFLWHGEGNINGRCLPDRPAWNPKYWNKIMPPSHPWVPEWADSMTFWARVEDRNEPVAFGPNLLSNSPAYSVHGGGVLIDSETWKEYTVPLEHTVLPMIGSGWYRTGTWAPSRFLHQNVQEFWLGASSDHPGAVLFLDDIRLENCGRGLEMPDWTRFEMETVGTIADFEEDRDGACLIESSEGAPRMYVGNRIQRVEGEKGQALRVSQTAPEGYLHTAIPVEEIPPRANGIRLRFRGVAPYRSYDGGFKVPNKVFYFQLFTVPKKYHADLAHDEFNHRTSPEDEAVRYRWGTLDTKGERGPRNGKTGQQLPCAIYYYRVLLPPQVSDEWVSIVIPLQEFWCRWARPEKGRSVTGNDVRLAKEDIRFFSMMPPFLFLPGMTAKISFEVDEIEFVEIAGLPEKSLLDSHYEFHETNTVLTDDARVILPEDP